MPQVGHTSGFTKAAGCPRRGLPGDTRREPHPPPCAGYRMHYIRGRVSRPPSSLAALPSRLCPR
eukprot:5799747-Prymnesium_polylepis.1